MNTSELSEVEIKILEGLYKLGNQYLQRDLWKAIGVNSKIGIPYLTKLEKKGLITREKTIINKKTQYIIKLTEKGVELVKQIVEKEKYEKEDIYGIVMSIPCFYCPYIDICGKTRDLNPETCEFLSRWIYEKTSSVQYQ